MRTSAVLIIINLLLPLVLSCGWNPVKAWFSKMKNSITGRKPMTDSQEDTDTNTQDPDSNSDTGGQPTSDPGKQSSSLFWPFHKPQGGGILPKLAASVDPTIPRIIDPLNEAKLQTGRRKIVWLAVKGAKEYKVRKTNPCLHECYGNNLNEEKKVKCNDATCDIYFDLPIPGRYSVTVAAILENGQEKWSKLITFDLSQHAKLVKPVITAPATKTVNMPKIGSNIYDVKWAKVDGASNYIVNITHRARGTVPIWAFDKWLNLGDPTLFERASPNSQIPLPLSEGWYSVTVVASGIPTTDGIIGEQKCDQGNLIWSEKSEAVEFSVKEK